MYHTLTIAHSYTRWAVLLSLIYSILVACRGLWTQSIFSSWHNKVRHWTATIAHIQLMIGMLLYTQSPAIRYFWQHKSKAIQNPDAAFFALIHLLLMMGSIVIITVGSALAKRRPTNKGAFRTMLTYYSAALLLIAVAIPWPGSPLAQRPLFR